jgi:hypothetical protein
MSVKIQLKRTTASAWTSLNPTLDNGEIGYETDTAKFKIGNGSTAWTSLAYANANLGSASLDALADVTAPSPTTNDVLQWNGTAWVNVAASTVGATNLDGLSDVVVTSPLQFQGLMYDGTNWVNSNIPDTYLVRNNTGSTILKGTLVGAVGAEPSGRIDVAPFEVTGTENSELRAMGIVTSNISSGVNGAVMSFGTLTGLDTRGDTASALAVGDETWAAGDILFAHPTVAGKLTNIKPQHDLAVAFITVRHASAGQIAIRIIPSNNHLEWMHDVSLVDKTSGDFLKYNGTLWVNDQINLGTDTVGNYVESLVAGTGVTLTNGTASEGGTPTIGIGQAVGTTSNVQFNDVTVDGNLTVNGTTTTLNTDTLAVEDNIIVLNSNVTAAPTLNAGIEIERGTSANVLVRWNETNDKWEVTNDGTVYGNIVTSADSGTVTSTMIADGTIVNADINASAAIADTKLETISSAGKVSNSATTATDANTANAIVARDASGNFTAGTITAALSGNASTATTLATARNIAGQSFNGSANISIAPTDLTGVTSTATEINILDGATLSTTELNYVDGVTSAIQTQLDAKAPLASPTFTGTPSLPTGTTAVTQTLGNNTTAVATTAFIQTALANFGGMTVSDTAPTVDVSTGDFWYDSTGLNLYIYYSSSWIQVTIDEPIFFELSELIGVVIGDLLPNQTLRFDGVSGNWVNSSPRQNISNSSLTTYGVTSANSGNMIVLDSSSAVSVNLGTWTDANVGEKVDIVQKGTGQVTVNVSGSVSVVSPGNSVTTRVRYSTVTATCISANLFLLSGDLA